MSISTDDLGRLTQQTAVLAADGDKLGSVHQVYTSDTTGDPAWVTVKTGLFGTQESFVPLSDASFDGDDIRVAVTKDAVHGAPRVDADGHLTPEEEDELYRYYGLHNPDEADTTTTRGDRLGDDRLGDDREDRLATDRDDRDDLDDRRSGDDDRDLGDHDDRSGTARTAGAAAAGAALGGGVGHDRTGDDLDDRSVAAENGPEHVRSTGTTGAAAGGAATLGPSSAAGEQGEQEAVVPGERTTRLRRYVVTERVVQTVEELPDEDDTAR